MNKKSKILNVLISLSLLWLILFVMLPFILIFIQSITDNGHFTLSAYQDFLSFSYLKVTLSTFVYASLITVLVIFVSINFAFIISKSKYRNLLILLVIIPTYMNLLLKIYAFIGLLGDAGVINQTLSLFNLHLNMLFTLKGFLIVSIYIFIPISILPIYYSIIKFDESVINAAYDLGADSLTVLYKVIIPEIKNTIYGVIQLVFIPSLSLFVVAKIIAGNKIMTLGSLIEQNFLVNNNWQLGAVCSIALILLATITMYVIKRRMKI